MTTQQAPLGSGFSARATAQEVMEGIDLAGRTALVTGGYSGLGLETTRALCAAGARVIVPARRPDLAADRLAGTGARVVALDLADLESVRRGARYILASAGSLDLLFLTAGIMATPERRVGPGWESQFAVNHLGHFALTSLLTPSLRAAGGARVVAYSSAGHFLSDIRWDDTMFDAGYDKWAAYGQSKTANVLFAVDLDRRLRGDGVRAFALHPGPILTDLQRDLPREEQVALGWIDEAGNALIPGLKTPSQGAATGLWAATSPRLEGLGGLYLEDVEVARIAGPGDDMDADGGVQPYAVDLTSAARLWEYSADLTGARPAP